MGRGRDMFLPYGWFAPRRQRPKKVKMTKPSNQQVFAAYARTPGKFKAGDRVMLKEGSDHGTVTSVRANGVFWKPDTRQTGGDIFIDADKLLPEM